jgi:hypothetical protein
LRAAIVDVVPELRDESVYVSRWIVEACEPV